MMDIDEIKRVIPHRYPFLLVDRVTECDMESRIVGIKNVTTNEPFSKDIFRYTRSCREFLSLKPLLKLPAFWL